MLLLFKNLNFHDLVAKFNLWVTIPRYCLTSGYRNPEVAQPPGYIWKSSNQAKGKLLGFVSKSLQNNLHSQFLDIVTLRLCNLRVTTPGGCEKHTYFS